MGRKGNGPTCSNLELHGSLLGSKMHQPWAKLPPRRFPVGAHDWGQVLTFQGKSGSVFGSFTRRRWSTSSLASCIHSHSQKR